MSEEIPVTPPSLPVPDGKVKTAKEFAGYASELTDEEIAKTVQVIYALQAKFKGRSNNARNLESLRDEALTRLAEFGVLATFDPSPCFYGEPPVLEIIGKIKGDPIYKHGFDHERKQHEVVEAKKKGEDYHGQKERPNKRKSK